MIKRMFGGVAVAAGLAMAVAVSPAQAVTIAFGSELGITGTNSANFGADTITFGTPSGVNIATGDFAAVFGPLGGETVTLAAGALDYSNLAAALGVNALFSISEGLNSAALFVTANTFVEIAATGVLIISGEGILTLTGKDATSALFNLTANTSGGTSTLTMNFSSAAVAVPGPIVGAGLPGLLLACGALLLLARRRRMMA
jgi:hypothetical protein